MLANTTTEIKDSKDLRKFLIDKMVEVTDDKISVDKVKAVANLAQQVYNTLNIEQKFAALRSKIGDADIRPVSFDGQG